MHQVGFSDHPLRHLTGSMCHEALHKSLHYKTQPENAVSALELGKSVERRHSASFVSLNTLLTICTLREETSSALLEMWFCS